MNIKGTTLDQIFCGILVHFERACESKDYLKLIGFHSHLQIVVEVAEEGRLCRFGEKIRESKSDLSRMLNKSVLFVNVLT